MAMIWEVPTSRLLSNSNNPKIGVFARSEMGNVQQDRMGRPAINTALIPKIAPRNDPKQFERRTKFNTGHPRNDQRDFRNDMISVLTTVYGRPLTDATNSLKSATGIANLLLPDLLTYDTTSTDGFPNGRRLRDDVIDFELGLLTDGGLTSDNVGDDNGAKITDGTNGPAKFPYIGDANANPTGPNP